MSIIGPRRKRLPFAAPVARVLDSGPPLIESPASSVRQFDSKAKQQLSDSAINFYSLDLRTFVTDAGAPLAGYQQQTIPIRGDWLYIDPTSSGGVRADLIGRQQGQYVPTVSLAPGVVIRAPFNQLVVYRNQLGGTGVPIIQPGTLGESINYGEPLLKIWYGTGQCPFDSPPEARGAAYIGAWVETNTQQQYTIGFQVTDNSIIRDAFIFATKICAAGEVSVLISNAVFLTVNGELVGRVGPTCVQFTQQVSNLRSDLTATYRDIRVPRWAAIFQMRIVDVGTAVTNVYSNNVGSLTLG